MKQFFTLLFILCLSLHLCAQDTLINGGFEKWHGGFFSPPVHTTHGVECCGAALAVPDEWGIPEQLMAMPTNHFVFRITDTANIHSGHFSAKLLTDITTSDSAGDVAGGLAVLVPGSVTCAGIVGLGSLGIQGDLYRTIAYSTGLPYADTPMILSFYMKLYHDVPDTALYAYAFTRWDSVNHREDTLAFRQADIPDAGLPMSQWIRFMDTIQYQLYGLPDTLHMIFYGGRNADPARAGNVTWLDDIRFYHSGEKTNTGIAKLSADALSVYPNPAAAALHVRIDENISGSMFAMYDLSGKLMMTEPLHAKETIFDISVWGDGLYLYRWLDADANPLMNGKISISH